MAQRRFTLEQAYLKVVRRLTKNQFILQSTENDQLHLYQPTEKPTGVVVLVRGLTCGFVRYLEPEEVSDGI